MKSQNLILLAVAAGAIYFFVRTKKLKQTKKFAQFTIKGITLKGLKLICEIGVQNPVSSSLKLNSFVGGIVYGGSIIASVTNFKPVTIAGNKESTVELTLKPKGLGILTAIKTAISKKVGYMGLMLKGTANINNAVVPIAMKF